MKTIRISDITARAKARFSRCWAEVIFITMLELGMNLLLYTLILLLGRLTGAHTADTVLPIFSSLPLTFLIPAILIIVLFYLATSPIIYGIKWYYWQAAEGNSMPVSSVFAGFSSLEYALRCVKLRVMTDLHKFTFTAVFGVIISVCISMAKEIDSSNAAAAMIVLAAVLAVVLLIMLFVLGIKYIPVGYLLADNPDSTVDTIMEYSRGLMNNKSKQVIVLFCSFIGWYISCILVFTLLLTIPYVNMCTAIYISDCVANEKEIRGEGIKERRRKNLSDG